MLPSVVQRAEETIATLFSFITAQGSSDYLGEKVSQLEHSLQTAHLARKAGADDETVLGALLHDVGRFIPQSREMPKMIAPGGTFIGTASHEVVGERYLKELGFSEKICQLVGAHVMAKRYLTAVDGKYYDGLSQSSKQTLKFQGGIFNDEQVKEAQKDPWLEQKLAVRRWDDLAKDPNLKSERLSFYEDMAINSLLKSWSGIELHSRKYSLPQNPTVVVCVDGFDPEYLDEGIKDGIIPNLAKFAKDGFHKTAKSCMPSFTNPNNVSIITGVPPSVHGIAGNYYLDPLTREEHMIVDDTLLRGTTVLALLAKRGVRVAAVTAKDKLRRILSHDLEGLVCFSSKKAKDANLKENGIENVEEWIGRPGPAQYSGDLSIYVLDAGIKLLEEERADILYLTLSDFIQHKYAPGDKEANDLMKVLDARIGRMVELGAVVAMTGDHGMSDKSKADGTPNVIFLEDELTNRWGPDCARVICPISDPFVRHHGALGSFVRVYVKSKEHIGPMLDFCKTLTGIEVALSGEEAAGVFEQPLDREGDLVIVSEKNVVIGSRKDEHDLSNLKGHRLRSHGGLSEQEIPLLMSQPAHGTYTEGRKNWRNFDIFDLVLNGAHERA
ncbi:Phosphonoacetate hydrolase [Mollisia scopiformis]|uniref:Phosphonoacetate hydrolase n=1 Tax=Mollisia scopiformis TaxID=149040 RepID=A0A132BCL4_MOLSC|nr:Phosphonoacetate hydrolase [Mollisia scopiformis]KUJ10170.1 Phosphonoacetate hydrolase [Mollisia scopiformis]